MYYTVAFEISDDESFREFFAELREKYAFAEDIAVPVKAFAVSASNMFEEQDVIDAILNSDMGPDEKAEMIACVPCHEDLRSLCAEWEIVHPYDDTPRSSDK